MTVYNHARILMARYHRRQYANQFIDMKEPEYLFFENRKSFRNWLEKNHDTNPGIWMIFHKKHVNLDGITYPEALEEALCFGWIDSIIKKVDDDRYVRKFTPRTNISKWSDVNRKIVLRLMEKGMMTEAGFKKIDIYVKTGSVDWKISKTHLDGQEKTSDIPDFILQAFAENEPALSHFHRLAPTYQKHYIRWITSARKEETTLSRLKEAVELLKENRKLGLK